MVSLADFTVQVEVATGDTPRTASPTYTDLSTYVRAAAGVSCQRGRSNEFDVQAQPGRASWEFRNTDGRFTVGNGSSPYAPVQIRRPCRVRVVYGGTTYPLWAGFIDSWGNGREELTGVARVEASDRLARAGVKMPAALIADMLYDSPSVLYPLGDAEFSTTAGDVTGAAVPSLSVSQVGSGGSVDFGSGTAPGPDDGTVAAFTRSSATNGKRLLSSESPAWAMTNSGESFTLEAMVRPSAAQQMSAARLFNSSGAYVELGTSSTGKARAIIDLTALGWYTYTVTGTSTLSTTATTHIAFTCNAGVNKYFRLYVNGVEEAVTGPISAAGGTPAYNRLTVGGHSSGDMWDGQISHVAAYSSALSATRILSHADGRNGWTGDLPADRFERLTQWAALSYASDGTGSSTMGPQSTKGQPLSSLLSQVAEAEAGVCYVNNEGMLTLGTRAARYDPAVALTLDATKPGQVPEGFGLDTDDGLLVNDYTVERPQGATQRVTDAASITAYDTQAETATLYVDSDDQARTLAEWRVYTGSSPVPRASQLTVDAVAFANSGGTVANLLGIEIGDRVQVTNLPSDVAASSTLDLFVEGVAWRIDKERITVTLTVSPLGAAGSVFVFDDAEFGKFDTGGVIAA